MQAKLRGHSELVKHSGLQLGGLPMKPIAHEQTACLLISWHLLLGPQGDGTHGFSDVTAKKCQLFRMKKKNNNNINNTHSLQLFSVQCFYWYNLLNWKHTFYFTAWCKSISCCARRTAAHGYMFNDCAFSIISTYSRAWILTLSTYACFVIRTIWTLNTFWSASDVRVAQIFSNARTNSIFAVRIWSTRGRIASIDWSYWLCILIRNCIRKFLNDKKYYLFQW